MKVTISYGCELEDIPKAIADLINILSTDDIEKVSKDIERSRVCLRQGTISEAMACMDSARLNLAKIDGKLMDYSSIVAGYVKTDADLKVGIDPTQEPDPENAFDVKEIIDDQVSTSNQSQPEE